MDARRDDIFRNLGLLLFRVGLSLSVFIAHGVPKLTNMINGQWEFPDPVGLGPEIGLVLSAGAESVCALLIALGAWTRLSTIPLIFTMIVAVWIINGGTPFIQQEKSFVYLLGWLLLLFAGPGKYTVGYFFQQVRQGP